MRFVVSLVLPVMTMAPDGAFFIHLRRVNKDVMVLPERTEPTQRFNLASA